ncbi:MAG: type II toxin-antitoxin system prevent-host-death family antitoxin [Phycisphaerales bacterium]
MSHTSTLDITEARRQFNSLDQQVEAEQVVFVTRHGKRVFAVVNVEFLEAVLETIEIVSDPESFRQFQQSLDDIRRGRVRDHDAVKKELGL